MTHTIAVRRDEDGDHSVSVPALKGRRTSSATLLEARAKIREGAAEAMKRVGEIAPFTV